MDDLVARLQRHLDCLPEPDGRTFHPMHVETLLAEAKTRIEALEAALQKIANMTPDPEFGTLPIEAAIKVARAALAGEKKDG